jgi:glycosyltransferase involved in cell wall biosynthesis
MSLALRRNVIRCAVHFAGAPWLAKEVEAMGLPATFVPVPALLPEWAPPPLPDRPVFLIYIPEGRESFYGWPLIEQAARTLPSVRFLVLKHRPIANAPANIEFLGSLAFADMAKIYARSTGIVRLPEHDGMSMTVLEALAYGRHVIWNYPFGACRLCERNSADLVQQIERCSAAGQLNDEARHVLGEWRAEQVLDRFVAALERVEHLPLPSDAWTKRMQHLLRDLANGAP